MYIQTQKKLNKNGIKWLETAVRKEYKESEITREQLLEKLQIYTFKIYEFNPKNIENLEAGNNLKVFNKNEKWEDFIYNLKPAKTEYLYNYNGELQCCTFEMYYKDLIKDELVIYNLVMGAEDFEKGAGKKFKVGDIVRVKDKEYKFYDKPHIIKSVPYKKKNQKYFENFYSVTTIENKEEYESSFHESELELFKKYNK